MAGKRKVSPPGTRRRKHVAAEIKKQISTIDDHTKKVIHDAKETGAYLKYLQGDLKSLNSAIGYVLKQCKISAHLVRYMLEVAEIELKYKKIEVLPEVIETIYNTEIDNTIYYLDREFVTAEYYSCLLYTSPSPRD